MVVQKNIDDLFLLPGPAAMRRGANNGQNQKHGTRVDGSRFFRGEEADEKPDVDWPMAWCQGTGINAGRGLGLGLLGKFVFFRGGGLDFGFFRERGTSVFIIIMFNPKFSKL